MISLQFKTQIAQASEDLRREFKQLTSQQDQIYTKRIFDLNKVLNDNQTTFENHEIAYNEFKAYADEKIDDMLGV